LQLGDGLVDVVLYTQFADKMTIIRISPRFSFEKNSFKRDFQQIQSLRDNLAHANNYAACSEAAHASGSSTEGTQDITGLFERRL
jgi:hypothetical protein